jgi:hypothetical protein
LRGGFLALLGFGLGGLGFAGAAWGNWSRVMMRFPVRLMPVGALPSCSTAVGLTGLRVIDSVLRGFSSVMVDSRHPLAYLPMQKLEL